MGLTKTQQMIWERSRSLGQAVVFTDAACEYLVARIAIDLGLADQFPKISDDLRGFFDSGDFDALILDDPEPRSLFERLVVFDSDADMYYACLATLHKARLKYENILETQPIPTLEQVGP